MGEFPFPLHKSARAADVVSTRQAVASLRTSESEALAQNGVPWITYDRGAFEESFGILNTFIAFRVITRSEFDTFFSTKRNVVEIGGPAGHLSQDLRDIYPGSIGKTVGITLVDHHFPQPQGHTVIEGDCTIPRGEPGSPYDNVISFVGEQQTDLVVSRMKGGLNHLPKDPFLFARIAADIYEHMLSKDGMMLFELPESVMPFLPTWVNQLYDADIDVNYVMGIRRPSQGDPYNRAYLMLRKTKDSPRTLPLLTVEDVRRVYRSVQDGSWKNNLQFIS